MDSILGQTLADFEFLIVDDGSTDGTSEILKSYADPRIQILTHETNQGISNALNHAIALARGEFIARMDGDDISFPQRLEKQVDFLRQNSDVGICCTWVRGIRADGKPLYDLRTVCDTRLYPKQFLFTNLVVHPSVMGRTKIFKENPYDPVFDGAEDQNLWIRLASKTRIKNMEEVLLFYREHKKIGRNLQKEKNRLKAYATCQSYAHLLGVDWDTETIETLWSPTKTPEQFRKNDAIIFQFLTKLSSQEAVAYRLFFVHLLSLRSYENAFAERFALLWRSKTLCFYKVRFRVFLSVAFLIIRQFKIRNFMPPVVPPKLQPQSN
jgi:glycosyltransferase involved in cell wall biosynthesis